MGRLKKYFIDAEKFNRERYTEKRGDTEADIRYYTFEDSVVALMIQLLDLFDEDEKLADKIR